MAQLPAWVPGRGKQKMFGRAPQPIAEAKLHSILPANLDPSHTGFVRKIPGVDHVEGGMQVAVGGPQPQLTIGRSKLRDRQRRDLLE
jgi:hypothetical protein